MQRARFIAVAVVLGAAFGAGSWQPLEAQDAADCRTPRAACDGFDRFSLFPSNTPTWSPQDDPAFGPTDRARLRRLLSE